jgi:hypothetical protein
MHHVFRSYLIFRPSYISLRFSGEVVLTSALFAGTRTPRSKITSPIIIRPTHYSASIGRVLPLVCQRWHLGRLYHCLVTVPHILPSCILLANFL